MVVFPNFIEDIGEMWCRARHPSQFPKFKWCPWN